MSPSPSCTRMKADRRKSKEKSSPCPYISKQRCLPAFISKCNMLIKGSLSHRLIWAWIQSEFQSLQHHSLLSYIKTENKGHTLISLKSSITQSHHFQHRYNIGILSVFRKLSLMRPLQLELTHCLDLFWGTQCMKVSLVRSIQEGPCRWGSKAHPPLLPCNPDLCHIGRFVKGRGLLSV